MLSEDQLKKKAVEDCQSHVTAVVTGDITVEPDNSGLSWDTIELRHIFDQHMIVWRRCADFTVVLNGSDEPVGYIDGDKWNDCEWAQLSHETIVALSARTGFVPADSTVLSAQEGPEHCVEATLSTEPQKADAPRYVVRINPTRQRVISILPQEAQS
jgi:hypothetical protein